MHGTVRCWLMGVQLRESNSIGVKTRRLISTYFVLIGCRRIVLTYAECDYKGEVQGIQGLKWWIEDITPTVCR